ncbi:putative ferredoxin [Megasphaera vaginalis (ex Srinivasan et al. 2021)]|uniref:Ferredoxin n=2 Tax=Megasphaera TaxID=906 RepID=U7UIS3_9FIRM|nr:putative ferredoxin [Megasphaera vaginalis (ex Srinivasan et al. 2021)]
MLVTMGKKILRVILILEVNKMHVVSDECVKCGACADVCPVSCITEGETKYVVGDACIDCGACESVCPTGAIAAE